jgi:hypothetical protein
MAMTQKLTFDEFIRPAMAVLAASSLNAYAADPAMVQPLPGVETKAAVVGPDTVPPAPESQAKTAEAANVVPVKVTKPQGPMYLHVTPKVLLYDFTGGPDASDGQTHFLQQYNYAGDSGEGARVDADVDLTMHDAEHVGRVEREAFGVDNQRNSLSFDHKNIGAKAYYSTFTSASFGSGFMPLTSGTEEPNQIERTNVGGNITIKPAMLGGLATVTLGWDATERNGNQYTTIGREKHIDPVPGQQLPQETNLLIDERADRLSFALSASPKDLFEVAYEASYEKFANSNENGLPVPFVPSNPSYFFSPNASLMTHSLRLNKQFGNRAVVAGGYSVSWLEQLSTPAGGPATLNSDPQIRTDNAYLTFDVNATQQLSVEGYLKHNERDNDIDYSVAQNTVENIDSLEYGLSAVYRPGLLSSTLTAGWVHRDVDRDRILNVNIPYQNQSVSDEIYLKYKFRPTKALTLEVAPSYLLADKTAYTTEPENSLRVKLSASYLAENGMLVSGYYTYRHNKNDDLFLTAENPITHVIDTQYQNVDDQQYTAALTFAYSPRQTVSTYATLFWTQTDAETYYLSARGNDINGMYASVELFDQLNYKVNNLGAVIGLGWQATDTLALRCGYSLSQSWGRPAEGSTQIVGTEPASIDSLIHTISFGGDYALEDNKTLKAYYQFQYYEDYGFPQFSDGGLHNLMLGLSFKL